MYIVRRLKDFEASVRKLKQSGIKPAIFEKIESVIDTLANGQQLPVGYKDHKLQGQLGHLRECHIRADILMIYQIDKGNLILYLVNVGSHEDFF